MINTNFTKEQTKMFLIFSRPILKKVINETTANTLATQGNGMVDDGPYMGYPTDNDFKKTVKKNAKKLGWDIVGDILPKSLYEPKRNTKEHNFDTKMSTDMPVRDYKLKKDMKSIKGFNKWKKNSLKIANSVGNEIVKQITESNEYEVELFKDPINCFYVTNIDEIWYVGKTTDEIMNNPKNVYQLIYEDVNSKMLNKLIECELKYTTPLELYNEFKNGKKYITIQI